MSHVLRVGVVDQIGYFRAYNTDGSAKTDLTSATPGLSLSVFRVGASSVSIASLTDKAADDTAHSDGAIRQVAGNLYTIDLPDAATATQCPSVVVRGSYTGGVIEGLEHPIAAYNPALAYASSTQASDIETDTQNIQSRLPASLANGLMRAFVESTNEASSAVRYYKEITIPAVSQAGSYSGGWYPVYLNDDDVLQSRLLPTARDLYFTNDDGSEILPATLLPRQHINTLDGVWSWFSQPVAIYDAAADKTITTSLNADGYRYVTEFDHASGESGTYLLSTTSALADDHNNPAVCVRSDGKYLVAYCEHGVNNVVRMRVSSNSGDASTWGTEYTVAAGTLLSYVQMWRLAGEDRIYLLCRQKSGAQYQWRLITSDDDGATWNVAINLIQTGATSRPYIRTWSNGIDKIRLLFTNDENTEPAYNAGLYAIYYDGTWKNMDGTALGATPYAPAGLNASSIIFADSGDDVRWIGDITEGSDGSVHVLYYVYPDGDETDHDLYHASYSGGTWTHTKVMDEGNSITRLTSAEKSYPSAAVFDPLDWRNIAVGREVNGIREMEVWRGNSTGTAWSLDETITAKSSSHNFRPNYAYGRVAGKSPYLFWIGNGVYDSFLAYETAIRQHPGNVGGAALVKIDFDGADKTIRCYYGSGKPEDALIDFRELGVKDHPENLILGTVPVNGNVAFPESWVPWKSLNTISRNMQIDQSNEFPAWRFQNIPTDTSDRILFNTPMENSGTASALTVAKWVPNTTTRQNFISQNASKGGIILRVDTSTKQCTMFAILNPAGGLESITSVATFPEEQIHLLYAEYDTESVGSEFKLRIDEVEAVQAGVAKTSLFSTQSEFHCVGQRNNASYTERLTGLVWVAALSKRTLPKVYTDTLSRAFLNPTTWRVIGPEVTEIDDISQGVIAAINAGETTLATQATVESIEAVTDKLDTAMVLDGLVWQFTANALENAPAGGGGGGDSAEDIFNYFVANGPLGVHMVSASQELIDALVESLRITAGTDISAISDTLVVPRLVGHTLPLNFSWPLADETWTGSEFTVTKSINGATPQPAAGNIVTAGIDTAGRRRFVLQYAGADYPVGEGSVEFGITAMGSTAVVRVVVAKSISDAVLAASPAGYDSNSVAGYIRDIIRKGITYRHRQIDRSADNKSSDTVVTEVD